jgi:hypothetical protein
VYLVNIIFKTGCSRIGDPRPLPSLAYNLLGNAGSSPSKQAVSKIDFGSAAQARMVKLFISSRTTALGLTWLIPEKLFISSSGCIRLAARRRTDDRETRD